MAENRWKILKKGTGMLGVATLTMAVLLTGCSSSQKDSDKSSHKKKTASTGNISVDDVSEDELENVDTDRFSEENLEKYEALFDMNNTVSVLIEISDEELEKLQQDYEDYDEMNMKSPIYRRCDKVIISIGDEVYEIEDVGIRIKGNTSYKPYYDEKTGEQNLCHYKLSFNETFDNEEYYGEDAEVWESEEERDLRKARNFAGLSKIDLKWNKNYDGSHIREIYANMIYREAGVLAQNCNLCSLGINGENCGVVTLYEPVDETFIERNLPEEDWDGELYKCGWANSRPCNYLASTVTYGVVENDSGDEYNLELKTNKKSGDTSGLENVLNVINKEDVTAEEFESVVDKDNLVNYLAASYFIGNPDDLRNNYNNHYVYICKSSGKAIIIPYDTDRCLGITYHWNPDGTGLTEAEPFSEYAEASGDEQTNPLITKTILNNGFLKEDYKTALAKVAASDYWNEKTFESYYEIAKENYEAVVEPTIEFANVDHQFSFYINDPLTYSQDTNMSFKDYTSLKMDTYNACIINEN